ncbi:four-carbon acid sugar kinase family protein [Phytohabitans flavus]|uniref:four-carbon acid sugar kinase family protein n=1 Tax=Phytohabitans flavus TaxID=1076124 RepID=UPI0036300B66
MVTVRDPEEYRAALPGPTPTGFVLTNTRGMAEPAACAVNAEVAADLFRIAAERDAPLDLVSRGDSTLRGHFLAEIEALDAARRTATGRGHDAVLVVPAYLEAGRVTVHDVHWARTGDEWLPVGETESARDATFGYRSSNLRDYVVEMGRGTLTESRVSSIGLDDIRTGGPDRVAELLDAAPAGGFVVVNALDNSDLDTVALAALTVQSVGKAFLYRTGPSFVRALAGQDPGRHSHRPTSGRTGTPLGTASSSSAHTSAAPAGSSPRFASGYH